MRMLLQIMYGHVHTIANFSALKIQSRNKMNNFMVNDPKMMSVKFQIYNCNTPASKKVFVKLWSMYGNAITENVLARSYNCEFFSYK